MSQLAFDKSSIRSYDIDGRLHVKKTNLSREEVSDYLGDEIPDWETLGLDPKRVYQLYRPAEELEKSAASFNNMPLLSQHEAVSASDHRPDLVIGSIGNDVEFVAPFLRGSLVVWSAEFIKSIESGEQEELSCAYRYDAVLEPGEFNGKRYQIVMRNLVANHVALVQEGRVNGAVVGDSLPQELKHMSNKPLSRTAMLAKGALLAHLMPRLAADAKFDLNPILAGVTAANWLTRKASIVDAIKPKLAADADLGAIHKLMDSLDDEKPAEDTDDPAAEPAADPAADPKADPMDANVIGDADPIAEVMEMLQGKLSDEDLAAVKAKLDGMKMSGDDDGDGDEDESLLDKIRALVAGDKPAQDSPPKVDPVDPPIVQDADTDDKDDKEKPFTKAAMDSAIGRAVKDAEAKTVARMRAAAEAEEAVKPYVGKLATAFDSAESVYKAALETLGVGTAKLHPSAYRAVLEAQPKPAGGVRRMASDEAANADSVATQFPGLAATRVI